MTGQNLKEISQLVYELQTFSFWISPHFEYSGGHFEAKYKNIFTIILLFCITNIANIISKVHTKFGAKIHVF